MSGTVVALAVASAAAGRWLLRASSMGPMSVILPPPVRPAPAVRPAAQATGAVAVVTPNASFYRIDILLDLFNVPLDTWRLSVTGLVETPFELTYAELLKLPMVERFVTLTCVSNEVGGDLVGNARWQGVLLADLLARARPKEGADFLVSRSVDGFTVGCPLAAAGDGRPALVAVGMNGEPLPIEHGFPARLVVSGFYGYVSATKWLRSIELTTREAFARERDARGLATQDFVHTESRIDTPQKGSTLRADQAVVIAGVAWAQHRGISRVEVQIDDGPWTDAALAEAISPETWRQWSFPWTPPAGTHRIRIRATDGQGRVQTEERRRPAQGGATGWHTIQVVVS
jgi:DMSO/TMAO reductase YedYZ molybdopterin-dependent catalytic subunit